MSHSSNVVLELAVWSMCTCKSLVPVHAIIAVVLVRAETADVSDMEEDRGSHGRSPSAVLPLREEPVSGR